MCKPVLILRKVVRCYCERPRAMRCLQHKSLRKTMVPSDIDLQTTNKIHILPVSSHVKSGLQMTCLPEPTAYHAVSDHPCAHFWTRPTQWFEAIMLKRMGQSMQFGYVQADPQESSFGSFTTSFATVYGLFIATSIHHRGAQKVMCQMWSAPSSVDHVLGESMRFPHLS